MVKSAIIPYTVLYMQLTRKEIDFSGTPVSCLFRAGEGVPIIFLHGWGGSALSWEPLWQALQTTGLQRPFIAIDLPGFGHTPPPPIPWSVRDYAECVAHLMTVLHIQRTDIVSHSFGGRVSWYLLTEWSSFIQQAICIAPAGIRHARKQHVAQPLVRIAKTILHLPGLRQLFPVIRRYGYRLIGGQDYLKVNGVMKTTFQRVVEEDLSPLLPQIQQPVEIFFGIHDSYVPWTDGEYMKKMIPHAHLTVFKDGKHGIHLTHAPAIATTITPLLQSPII
jgi:pimeloyl-ACP methyl ester carboxylesterase